MFLCRNMLRHKNESGMVKGCSKLKSQRHINTSNDTFPIMATFALAALINGICYVNYLSLG